MIRDLSEIPAVGAYLRRIGAAPRGMRTAAVRATEGRYKRDLAVIKLGTDGQVTVKAWGSNEAEYEPTDSERYAIAIEAKAATWPEHIRPSSTRGSLPQILKEADPDGLFKFRDEDGNIVMLQQRKERDEGGKDYLPWTYWSDSKWRVLEPDGPLPLWGIDQLKTHNIVYLHEGARAARAMRKMVEAKTLEDQQALAAHPWGEQLGHCAHLGWIGGALSPHRTDWSVLNKLGVKKVYIVADNDDPGLAAVPKIARELRAYPIIVNSVRFDGRFPVGFDLADPFPESMFKKAGGGQTMPRPATLEPATPYADLTGYSGPSLRDCAEPATWATRVGAAPAVAGRGRPAAAPVSLRTEFTGQWLMVAGETKPVFVARHDPTRLYSEEAFNTLVRPFSDVKQPADLFKALAYESHVAAIAYEPRTAATVVNIEGALSVNMHAPSQVRPVQGDPAFWEQFLEHLFPDPEDRWQVKRWVATLIAKPDIRMKYGLLLASTVQGVGKTTLCEIMRVLVGERNCSAPSAKDVVESSFNGWIVRKRLVFVNEIYEGSSWPAYNKIKSYVTDETLLANEKFVPQYSIKNWAHFILSSNSTVALRIDAADRRFLVPAVTEAKQPAEFWERFYSWLAGGGYGVIKQWAEDFFELHGHKPVGPGEDAPMTERKQRLIDDSRSPEERLVMDLAAAACELATERGDPIVLVDEDIKNWLQNGRGGNARPLPPMHVMRGWLRTGGLYVSVDRLKAYGVKQHVFSTRPLDGRLWSELRPYHETPDKFQAF